MFLCLLFFVCMQACVFACRYIYVEVRGQLHMILRQPSTLLLKTVFPWGLGFTDSARLGDLRVTGIFLSKTLGLHSHVTMPSFLRGC